MASRESQAEGACQEWDFARALALGVSFSALLLLVWLLVAVKSVILLAMLAILFALLLDSGVRGLQVLFPFPRWVALLVLWGSLTILIVVCALLLAPQVSADLNQLAERMPAAMSQIESSVRNTAWGSAAVDQLSQLKESSALREAGQRFFGLFSSVVGVISAVLVVIALGIFVASEPMAYVRGGLRLLPPASRARGGQILATMGRALRWWLIGRFASMGIVFLLTWIGLALLGVPLPLLLALIAGLFSFVPTFGPMASAVPAVLVGLSTGPQQALWVALLYLGVQMFESYGITPLIQRRVVRIPPALLVLFQLMMAVLAGVLGVLLATPILVVLMVLVGMLYVEDRLGEATDLP